MAGISGVRKKEPAEVGGLFEVIPGSGFSLPNGEVLQQFAHDVPTGEVRWRAAICIKSEYIIVRSGVAQLG